MGDKERVEFIRYKWQDAENYKGDYTARHDEVDFLLVQAEQLVEMEEKHNAIEKI